MDTLIKRIEKKKERKKKVMQDLEVRKIESCTSFFLFGNNISHFAVRSTVHTINDIRREYIFFYPGLHI